MRFLKITTVMLTRILLSTGVLLSTAVHAATRTSAAYTLVTESVDFGGQRASSAHYASDGSLSTVGAVSQNAAQPTLAKHGYIGQLYELQGYGLLATNYYPSELGTTQILPVATADDGTNIRLPAEDFAFSVLSGPLSGVAADGTVSTAAVYEASEGSVGATSSAFSGQLELPIYVQDTLPDNFGSYAGDLLTDAWQVLHFGLGNPQAAPTQDPDGDGQNNRFEFTAGLIPTDAASAFRVRIEGVPGQPLQRRLSFSPVFLDRTYVVKSKASLSDPVWQPLTTATTDGLFPERSVIDEAATGNQKFYIVEIDAP